MNYIFTIIIQNTGKGKSIFQKTSIFVNIFSMILNLPAGYLRQAVILHTLMYYPGCLIRRRSAPSTVCRCHPPHSPHRFWCSRCLRCSPGDRRNSSIRSSPFPPSSGPSRCFPRQSGRRCLPPSACQRPNRRLARCVKSIRFSPYPPLFSGQPQSADCRKQDFPVTQPLSPD